MPSLVDVVDSSVLSGKSVLGLSSTTGNFAIPHALVDASVRTSLELPSRPARRIAIRARSVDRPEQFRHAVGRVIELLQLPPGWNTHGAEPVSDVAFVRTVEFLSEYLAAGVAGPAVVPTVRGGIQLEWHRQGVDIEVEVDPDGSVSWCAEDRETGVELEASLAGHEEAVRQWLKRTSD